MRKRQQEQHPGLTLTGIYNVLEKLRSGEPLTAKEKLAELSGLGKKIKKLEKEVASLSKKIEAPKDWRLIIGPPG